MIYWYKNLNLRWRLSFLITLVAIYTTMTIALAVYFLWTDQIRKQVSERLQQDTELAVQAINKELLYEQNNLKAWAQLDVMLDIMSDDLDKRIINTLILLKKNYNLSGNLMVVTSDNKVIAATNKFDQEIYPMTKGMNLSGSLAGNAQLIMRVPIHLSIMPQGVNSGYLVLTHPWTNILEQLSSPLGDFLVVHNHNIFYFNNNQLKQTLPQNKLNLLDAFWTIQQREKLHSKKVMLLDIQNNSISIYGMVNKIEAFKPINATLQLIGIVALLLLIPILLISIWSSNRFLKPIINLQKVAEKIADSGDLSIVIPILNQDEIGKLAAVLNKMTSNLKQAFGENVKNNNELKLLTDNLENRVESRTKELSSALDRLKNAQSQLVQSEKMSSLGQLVAGIAHELNNPISSVHVNTPMLKQYTNDLIAVIDFINNRLSDTGEQSKDQQLNEIIQNLHEKLEGIDYDFVKEDITELLNAQEDAAKRIRDIVLSLRTFSRLDEAEIKSIDLNKGIDNTINILRHEIKHRIQIHKDYQLTEPVECFSGEINQVILNVLANAAQAISGQGDIWITTNIHNTTMARITISDNGPGLPQSLIEKIFDPFFTTKPVGVGTGLGLSISYGIIEKHHGHIIAENCTPNGAKFTIDIPIKQGKDL